MDEKAQHTPLMYLTPLPLCYPVQRRGATMRKSQNLLVHGKSQHETKRRKRDPFDVHVDAHEGGPVPGETPTQTAILEVMSVQKALMTWLTSSPEIVAYPWSTFRTDDTSCKIIIKSKSNALARAKIKR
jgi:hypothetical protein